MNASISDIVLLFDAEDVDWLLPIEVKNGKWNCASEYSFVHYFLVLPASCFLHRQKLDNTPQKLTDGCRSNKNVEWFCCGA
jgi:hypothetical protein